ncbi:MAG: HNH endonuclease [Chloroflexota bacterium]
MSNAEERLTLSSKALVLNQSYEPISVCSPRKAFILILLMKAELVAERRGQSIRSVSQSFPLPSIIRLTAFSKVPKRKIELSRKNIIKRDDFRCQYCGKKSPQLTVDHIIPKSRGGIDSWENLVAACIKCNNKKGSRTLEEAGLKLLSKPKAPHYIMFLKQCIGNAEESWKPFLFMD